MSMSKEAKENLTRAQAALTKMEPRELLWLVRNMKGQLSADREELELEAIRHQAFNRDSALKKVHERLESLARREAFIEPFLAFITEVTVAASCGDLVAMFSNGRNQVIKLGCAVRLDRDIVGPEGGEPSCRHGLAHYHIGDMGTVLTDAAGARSVQVGFGGCSAKVWWPVAWLTVVAEETSAPPAEAL